MKEYIDIHCHILPGLDDGARNMDETWEMLLTASEEGIRKIIATPHNYASHKSASPKEIIAKVNEVNAFARAKGLNIQIYPGNEIFYRKDVAQLLDKGSILTMAGSSYVLVEFYPDVDFAYLKDGVKELLRYGYQPILAHGERYDCLYRKKENLKEIISCGVLLQVNAASFLESFGHEWRRRSRQLLKDNMIAYIGTDAHSNRNRAPKLQQCASFLLKKSGTKAAERLLFEHAESTLLKANTYEKE